MNLGHSRTKAGWAIVVLAALSLMALGLAAGWAPGATAGAQHGAAVSMASLEALATLSGTVFEGPQGVEATRLSGVVVELYGSNSDSQQGRDRLDGATTDGNGWYSLSVPTTPSFDFYDIVETDPAGYTSVGASTVSGEVKGVNWIRYSRDGLSLTTSGNKFWDRGAATSTPTPTATPECWTLQGRVYNGEQGDESRPLQGVTVAVHGSNSTYPQQGTMLRSTVTDSTGWYALNVCSSDGTWEFFHLIETDPSGYQSVGATSVDGVVKGASWIQYTAPLAGKTLTGNKFWDRLPATSTPTGVLPPTPTPTASPTSAIPPTATPTATPTSVLPPTATPTVTPTSITPPTATPTVTPTSIIPPTATPTATATGVLPPTMTPTATSTGTVPPTPGACPEKLLNGDFETGSLAPWTIAGPVGLAGGRGSPYGAWLGGESLTMGELAQRLTIPSDSTAVTLEFWWLAESATQQPGDILDVLVQHPGGVERLRTWLAVDPLGEWRHDVLDLSAYAGRTVTITFQAHTDAAAPSTFRVDDVSLLACTQPFATPTTTPTATPPAGQWEFIGLVQSGADPMLLAAADVFVGLYASSVPEERGRLLATSISAQDGSYHIVYGSAALAALDERHVYWHLAIGDPRYHVTHASSRSGGEPTAAGWLEFRDLEPGEYGWNDFTVQLEETIERTFSGTLYRSEYVGDLSQPWPGAVIALGGATVSCDIGTLLVVVTTDSAGRFSFEYSVAARDDSPFYTVSVLDEDTRVYGAKSESGQYTAQGWVQFERPGAGSSVIDGIFASPVYGAIVERPAGADTYVKYTVPGANYGTETKLLTGYSKGIEGLSSERAYLSFDLSFISRLATIVQAELTLYLEKSSGESKVCMSLHQVTSAWYESSLTWDGQPKAYSSVACALYVDSTAGSKTWDVTSVVQSWVDESAANWGLLVMGPETGKAWSRQFSSLEGAHPPTLKLWVQSPGPIQTPTPTPTAAPTTRQVQITGVEVNQAIQDINTSAVPLIASKAAIVRVHLKVTDGKGDISDVTGKATFGSTTLQALTSSGMTAQSSPDRGQLDDSLNFYMAGKVATGSGTLSVEVLPPEGVTFSGGQLKTTKSLSFQSTPPLRVVLANISYTLDGAYTENYANAAADILSWLGRAYPVPKVTSKTVSMPAYQGDPTSLCKGAAWSSLLNWISTTGNSSNWPSLGAKTIWYGMVPDDYFESCPGQVGVAGMADTPGTLAAGITLETDKAKTGALAGHEIGHSLGRYHCSCSDCIAPNPTPWPYASCRIGPASGTLYGLDIVKNWVYDPVLSAELMSYCEDQWISDVTYKALRTALVQYPLASAESTELAGAIVVSGEINQTTGLAELGPIFRLDLPVSGPPEPGPCSIVLRNASGQTLMTYPFGLRTLMPQGGLDEDTFQMIHEVLPDHPALAQLEVSCEGRVLARRSASAHPPVVHLHSPNGGEGWESGPQTIRWEASDADGDPLQALVQVSYDDWATWMTLACGVTGTSLDLDTARLAGGPLVRVRVLMSDGLLTGMDGSDGPFGVVPKPPAVSIAWPQPGGRFRPGEGLVLSGSAYDPEDGSLEEESLSWSSDRDGDLGTGADVLASGLSTGPHHITLLAGDSEGMFGAASVDIFVGHALYVPVMLKH